MVTLLFSWIKGDDAQPAFQSALTSQSTVVELSKIAVSDAPSPDTRALAARIASTTSSDRKQLLRFYRASYGEPEGLIEAPTVQELDNTHEDFSARYRQLTLRHLQNSYTKMADLQSEFTNEEFNAIITQARSNHKTHIQTLKQRSR